MVIINAKINTCDHGQIIESGYIVIKNGKIAEVGDGIYRGDEAELYDAAGSVSYTHLTLPTNSLV